MTRGSNLGRAEENYVWTREGLCCSLERMPSNHASVIDFTEAAYDLEVAGDAWLSKLIEAGRPFLDHGLGVFALTCRRPLEPGPLEIDQLHLTAADSRFAEGIAALQERTDMALLWPITRPGPPKTLSEVTDDHGAELFGQIMRYFDFANDGLGINAFDPDGRGIFLISALPRVMGLSHKARERWQMVAAHFGAGYRLRRAIQAQAALDDPGLELPHGAEVVIDPSGFRVTEALGPARSPSAQEALRDAARRIDRARGSMRESDPGGALQLWQALVRGRWSTVDWFDSDGRRYVIGIPNTPGHDDPRGLTERELQVVAYVFYGLTNKMIAYHLGLSTARVSGLLSSAMRKLGVRTRAALIKRFKDFAILTKPSR